MISNNTLKIAVEALKLSSDYVINFYNKKINFKVKSKFSRDIVSDVDINSEKIIFTHLIKKFNKHNFILEERENIDNNSNFTWYIDPLDGTVNFSKGLEIFSISISLVHNNKFILGAVSIPFKNDLFYSHKGKTFKNGIILKCSNTTNIKKSLNVFVFDSDKHKAKSKEYNHFGKINDNTMGALRLGSTAYALTLLAEGKIDALIGFKIKTWDLYGGLTLAINSGCNYEIGNVSNNMVDYVLISNKFLFNSYKDILKQFISQ